MSACQSGAVSVVIPTARLSPNLTLVLERLCRDDAVCEVLVVDDRVGEHPPLAADPPRLVRFIRTPGGVGPNRARQFGVEQAVGNIVLLLDDDVVPSERLAAAHAARHVVPNCVVVGYMPVPPQADPAKESLTRTLYRHDYEKRVAGYDREPASILLHLWGGNVSISRADALRVGIASPAFHGHRHEDREFGIRCLIASLTGVFDRNLKATHEYERSVAAFLEDARAQGGELIQLQRLHSEFVPALREETPYSCHERLVLGAIVALGTSRRGGRIVVRCLHLGIRVASAHHARGLALGLLKLARQIQRRAGKLQESRGDCR